MMAWEEPVKAAENMAPYTYSTHFKDHIIIEEPNDKYGYVYVEYQQEQEI